VDLLLLETVEIARALDAFARDLNPPRGDENLLHVSDLAGCDLATWQRWHGNAADVHDPDTLRKFFLGFAVEDHVLTGIGRETPIDLGVRVALWLDFEGIVGKLVPEDYVPGPREFIGHPDGVTADAVLEVKSTEFFTQRVPPFARIVPQTEDDLAHHYRIQASAYALALGKPRAIVIVLCRASGIVTSIAFDPQRYVDEIEGRMRALLDARAAATPPHPTLHASTLNKKGESWLCKYCAYTACSLYRGGS
jgi:hypothetical protein